MTRKLLQGNSDCAKFFNQGANAFLNGGSGSPSPADDMLSSDKIEKATDLGSQIIKEGDSLRQPPAATTFQGTGFGSTINLNAYGAYYQSSAFIQGGGGKRGDLTVGGTKNPREFAGKTLEAQITILLHELAHTMNLIPSDGKSPGQSLQNTQTILDKCKDAIKALASGKGAK